MGLFLYIIKAHGTITSGLIIFARLISQFFKLLKLNFIISKFQLFSFI